MDQIRISETFFSLQGESAYVGLPTFFIRLTGCPLRCRYCDTAYAFHGGELMSCDELLALTKASGATYVCVTGGEPLAQPNAKLLVERLCDSGYRVSIETSGALSLAGVDSRAKKVMDIKTPASGEVSKNDYANLDLLDEKDEVKFVISDRLDYEWVKQKIQSMCLDKAPYTLLVSPEHGNLAPKTLAEWVLEDGLPVRFQLQLHKYIWGDVPGH